MQQLTQESESASTSKEAQALMNLNLKLQSTAAKAQSKTIDLELKKLESVQLAEHLRIVTVSPTMLIRHHRHFTHLQAYLPDRYLETEADSTTLFLFFQRVASKVDLLIHTISALHGIPSSLQSATSEALVGICELRGKLQHFSTLNKRFSGIMSRCEADDWAMFGKTLAEVGGVENKVDGWINGIRAEDFHEGDCARELGSLIAQFDHLAGTVFVRPHLDIGEQQLGLACGFDYDLDNFAAAVGFARQAIVGLTKSDGESICTYQNTAKEAGIEIDVGESSLGEGVYEPVQRILDLVRTVKAPAG